MQLNRAGCACPALILSSVVYEPLEKGDGNGSRFDQRPRTHVAKATEARGW